MITRKDFKLDNVKPYTDIYMTINDTKESLEKEELMREA